MNPATTVERLVGKWAAVGVVSLGVLYLLTGALWLVFATKFPPPEGFEPPEPIAGILRLLMLMLIALIVVLFSAVHGYAAPDRRIYSRMALVFVTIFAGISSVDNFLLVTVLRQTSPTKAPALAPILPELWSAVILPLELFAWGPVFGLGLLSAAPVFRGDKLHAAVRTGLIISGSLCMANIIGLATGDLRFSILGIIGYDFVFPAVCVLLAILFGRQSEIKTNNETRKS